MNTENSTPTGDPQPGPDPAMAFLLQVFFCKGCHGEFQPEGPDMVSCPRCRQLWPIQSLAVNAVLWCPECGSAGEVHEGDRAIRCPACNGEGVRTESQGAPSPAPAGDQEAKLRELLEKVFREFGRKFATYRQFGNVLEDVEREYRALPAPASRGTVQAPAAGPRVCNNGKVKVVFEGKAFHAVCSCGFRGPAAKLFGEALDGVWVKAHPGAGAPSAGRPEAENRELRKHLANILSTIGVDPDAIPRMIAQWAEEGAGRPMTWTRETGESFQPKPVVASEGLAASDPGHRQATAGLIVREGKTYRAVDGSLHGPMKPWGEFSQTAFYAKLGGGIWLLDGKREGSERYLDLVAEDERSESVRPEAEPSNPSPTPASGDTAPTQTNGIEAWEAMVGPGPDPTAPIREAKADPGQAPNQGENEK